MRSHHIALDVRRSVFALLQLAVTFFHPRQISQTAPLLIVISRWVIDRDTPITAARIARRNTKASLGAAHLLVYGGSSLGSDGGGVGPRKRLFFIAARGNHQRTSDRAA